MNMQLQVRKITLLLFVLCVSILPQVSWAQADDTTSLEELYWARQDSARAKFSQADVDFMSGMIGHHAQALVMSGFAPKNGASASVQILAARIINAQNDEINTMQRWLRDRGQTVTEVEIQGNTLIIHGGGHHAMHMPGMLTQDEMKELELARGVGFDRLFLMYMIKHHMGAVTMVRDLLAIDGAVTGDDTYKIATDIHVDQVTEIARMEQMLAQLPDAN